MIFLIFPTQLYNDVKILYEYKKIYLLEEPRYFTDFKFHKLKLAYHRASMKKYYDYLKKKKFHVTYIEYDMVNVSFYKKIGVSTFMRLPDNKLEAKLHKIFGKNITMIDTINFLIKYDELEDIKSIIYKNKKYMHEEFYKYQRKKLDILIENNKAEGGKWSYDNMNRLPLPKNENPPEIKSMKKNKYTTEAIKYVNKNFPSNYGEMEYFYPIDRKGSIKWLQTFLEERLKKFGAYEDAVTEKSPFVYHSVLSPMMNIGLITDMEIVEISYKYYKSHKIPIESYEGFIRQVIGWRNYVYTLYLLEGDNMYSSNILKHTNKLNSRKMWEGTTGILPIDSIINKIVKYGYCHHIERLMYLGNFMLLCMIDPKDVYNIFMEWTVDSYDWVMVPNVMGMSQFATNIMMTRPYFSSSNYIIRMSDYKKNGEWDKIFDSLYYNFIDKHYDMLKKNYATAQQVKHWDNKTDSMQSEMKKTAKEFIKGITL